MSPPRASHRPLLSERLVALLAAHPAMSVTRLAEDAEASQPEATRTLQALAQAGTLIRLRGGAYCLPGDEPAPREVDSMAGLTAIQRRAAILDWIRAEVVSPTMREMAEAFAVSSQAITADCRQMRATGALAVSETLGGRRNLILGPKAADWVDPNAHRPSSGGVLRSGS